MTPHEPVPVHPPLHPEKHRPRGRDGGQSYCGAVGMAPEHVVPQLVHTGDLLTLISKRVGRFLDTSSTGGGIGPDKGHTARAAGGQGPPLARTPDVKSSRANSSSRS